MNVFFAILMVSVFFVSGCATTRQSVAPINQVQNQMVDLEQRMEDQEKEIVDLKYEIKDLTGKVESYQEPMIVETSAPAVSRVSNARVEAVVADSSDTILRVAVAPAQVQKALKNAGSYDGKIDGKLGPKTRSAVMDFQRQHNLKPDGVIGKKTWAALNTYLSE